MENVELIDSSNRFALSPLSRCSRGRGLAYGYGHLSRVPFVSQPHMCLVREMNPPDLAALGHPPSTREGGALQRALLFPHMFLSCVVQGKHSSSYLAAFGRRFHYFAPSPALRELPGDACDFYLIFDTYDCTAPPPLRGCPNFGEAVRGAFLLTDFLICPMHLLPVSLICALYDSTAPHRCAEPPELRGA